MVYTSTRQLPAKQPGRLADLYSFHCFPGRNTLHWLALQLRHRYGDLIRFSQLGSCRRSNDLGRQTDQLKVKF